MKITHEMQHRAVIEAVNQGLIPKEENMGDYVEYWTKMKKVLKAAFGSEYAWKEKQKMFESRLIK